MRINVLRILKESLGAYRSYYSVYTESTECSKCATVEHSFNNVQFDVHDLLYGSKFIGRGKLEKLQFSTKQA